MASQIALGVATCHALCSGGAEECVLVGDGAIARAETGGAKERVLAGDCAIARAETGGAEERVLAGK